MTEGERQQNAGGTNAAPQHRKGHRRQESMYAMTGLYAESGCADGAGDEAGPSTPPHLSHPPRESVKCHSRNPSAGVVDRDRERDKEREKPRQMYPEILDIPHDARDCGILSWRPLFIQRFSSIKVFVFFLSFLVTLQQALSSGYINSVITTIEKRFEIPSSLSGLIASSYEIGNVITVIFVSYLGSRRHIPVWIAVGAVIMGIGSLVFVVPHFIAEVNSETLMNNKSDDNICRLPRALDQDMGGLGRLSQGLPPSNLRPDNCIKSSPSTFMPVMVFIVAQLLLGCGGSPLLTLGTTYVDDHVRPESSSMYIGCMYSMAAFGPVLGFLLGAYLLSFHMDSFSGTIISIDPGDHRWVGMWWGGFLLCGFLLILVAIPFFSFPKVLVREKEKIRLVEKAAAASGASTSKPAKPQTDIKDTGYGKDIKDIPVSMWRLLKNPVYVVTCLGACMELMIVSGFVVFLPKYLETQFSLGKSQASVFTGSIAIPGACIGIFMGGCLLKRLELRPKGAVQFVLISNTICLSCYALLFFLGCDNIKMAGTTIPYTNHSNLEPFKVNLTAACNFNCLCTETDMEPVCGNNGLTYFSPCHAGCEAFSSRSNFTNCACVHETVRAPGVVVNGAAGAAALRGAADYSEVTVVPVATAGACNPPCTTIFPFLVLLFFMTFVVAVTQMPLLMIVLRSVSEEERSFALGMQFVIFRLFGYIPAPIVFGNLIDSTCLLWKQSCSGEKGGRCLLYDIEQFRYRYVGLCGGIKIVALGIFMADWWLVRRRRHLETAPPLDPHKDIAGSIISLDKLFEELPSADNASGFRSGVMSGVSSATTTPMEPPAGAEGHEPYRSKLQRTESQYSQESQTRASGGKNSRVLVASRHLRNDSKTIQLEPRARQHSQDEPERRPARSDSRDSRDSRRDFPRSASRDLPAHSRSGSRDFKVHSRSDSRDLSLDQLKHLALKSMESLDLTVLPLTRCVDEESKRLIDGSGVLRHRRTSSKDSKLPETKHKRTSSHHITMEPNELSLQMQKGRSVDHLASTRLDPCV
ncbi:solute carrier organic anion transporter family member 3A1 [Helicoverpa zea]|uniref:solute carrier organic anion transporter family member 3A1 n=1 Tax=Helicoverpa zea TaxID=7113 RepID=UPI001F563096|nr:solute carrier organic anion transporter family member 3A1 [Helicoverpa zea]XP_047023099.1 solute carrier organic anion transporter family member 3A1 [Helicoverpa zea]